MWRKSQGAFGYLLMLGTSLIVVVYVLKGHDGVKNSTDNMATTVLARSNDINARTLQEFNTLP